MLNLVFLIYLILIYSGQAGDLSSVINDRGCIEAGEEWLERNLLLVAGVAVCIAFLQVLFYFIFILL